MNAIFLPLLSSSSNSMSGVAIASGNPGKTAPAPTSMARVPSSQGRTARLSRTCAGTAAASSVTEVRLMCAFQRLSSTRRWASFSAAPVGRSCPSAATPASMAAASRSVLTRSASPLASSSPVKKVMPEELHHRLLIYVPVFLAPVAVPFVQRIHVPHRLSLLPQRAHHLLRFRYGHPRVVLPLHDQHGNPNLFHVVQGTYPLQVSTRGRVALVAVLGAPQVPAIALGVLEESDEVADADHVHRGAQTVTVMHCARQDHVTAVAAAVHRNARLIQSGFRLDPVEQGADVTPGVLALHPVVQRKVRLAVSGRAPHVRHHHRDVELVQPHLVRAVDVWP